MRYSGVETFQSWQHWGKKNTGKKSIIRKYFEEALKLRIKERGDGKIEQRKTREGRKEGKNGNVVI